MSGKCVEDKVQKLESIRKTILSRLERIEKFVGGQDVEKGSEQRSMYHHADSVNNTSSCASSPSSHCQGNPRWSSPVVHTQPFSLYVNIRHPVPKYSVQICSTSQRTTSVLFSPLEFSAPVYCASDCSAPVYCASDCSAPVRSWPAHSASIQSASHHPVSTNYSRCYKCLAQGTSDFPKAKYYFPLLQWDQQGRVTDHRHFFRYHRNLKGESKAGMLAVRIARNVYFGEEVMGKCTVSGVRGLPGLPVAELNELKQTVFFSSSRSSGRIQWNSNIYGLSVQMQLTNPVRRFGRNGRKKKNKYIAIFIIAAPTCTLSSLQLLHVHCCLHPCNSNVCVKLY